MDSSAEHIVEAVARRVHEENPRALVIAESGLNDPRVMRRREQGGWECDAAWADDFHHSLRVLLTGDRDGYYADFGRVGQLAKAFHRPHVHDAGYSGYRRRRLGAPADDVPPQRFVVYCQDHDQVGNRAYGDRLPRDKQPLAAFCTLLSPFVPMVFMGEEYGERAPFQFFSDHIDKKIATATFEASKLTRERDSELARLYAQLLETRRRLPPGDADELEFDEDSRWLRVRRGSFELVCNFADQPARVPCSDGEVELATHGEPRVQDGHIELQPFAGALIA